MLKFNSFLTRLVGMMVVLMVVFTTTPSSLSPHSLSSRVPETYSNNAEIPLAIEFVSADPITRTFTTDWYPLLTPERCNSNPGKVVDIYIDPRILDASSPGWGILPNATPIHRHNASAVCKQDRTTVYPAFRAITKLLGSNKLQGSPSSSLHSYPFDIYIAPFRLSGLDVDTGEYVTLNVTQFIGGVLALSIDLRSSGEDSRWLHFSLEVTRSKATKVYMIIVGYGNWLMALATVAICAATLIYPSHEIYSEMFVVPLGAVFAFTSLRAGLPGAPSGFGANLDLYTSLPFLCIMSLSGTFLLVIVLLRRINVFGNQPCNQQPNKPPMIDLLEPVVPNRISRESIPSTSSPHPTTI